MSMKTWEELAQWGKALEARGPRIVALPEGYEREKAAGMLATETRALVAASRARREIEDAGLPECKHGHKHYCGHCGPVV